MQCFVPGLHTPTKPVLQLAPPPGSPSSTTPLQSSSTPLQASGPGPTFRRQARLPSWQCSVPAAQTPDWPVSHVPPLPGSPSSVCPLQLLSCPSQTSGAGAPAVALRTVPVPSPRQTFTPGRAQSPIPTEQAEPRSTKGSSTAPLQLSSRPLQVSTVG